MRGAALALLAGLAAGQAGAQGLPTVKVLPLAVAVEAAQAAIATCAAQGLHVSVAVVDRGGATKLLLVGDGAGPIATDTSRRKAYTAAALGISTGTLAEQVKGMPGGFPPIDPTILALPGGLPIRVGTDVIAAIGVGGADRPDKDEACAKAGLEAIQGRLQ